MEKKTYGVPIHTGFVPVCREKNDVLPCCSFASKKSFALSHSGI